MKKIFIVFILVLLSCNSRDSLELEILDKKIEVLKTDVNEFENNLSNSSFNSIRDFEKYKKNIVRLHYKLTNNTNNIYYLNLDNILPEKNHYLTEFGLAYVKIYDENNQEFIVNRSYSSVGTHIKPHEVDRFFLGYFPKVEINKTIIIYPNEVKYFEWYLTLPADLGINIEHYRFNFDYSKKYYLELLLYSNSENYKKNITNSEIQTIKENKYSIYNGYIKSKNRIPIVFINSPLL